MNCMPFIMSKMSRASTVITRVPAFLSPTPILPSSATSSIQTLRLTSPLLLPTSHNRQIHTYTPSCKATRTTRKPSSSNSSSSYHLTTNQTPKRRHLATTRTMVPDGTVHSLKADVSPTPAPSSTSSTSPIIPFDASGKVLLKGLTLSELEYWVSQSLNEKPFRARQLWRWLYRPDKLAATFEEMTDLSKTFRDKLMQTARIDALSPGTATHTSSDGTKKLTFRLTDGSGEVESVIIPTDGRTTLCVSSQWGCALNCQFCLTGRTGFKRSLTTAEIVDQVVLAKRFFEKDDIEGNGHRINNVVFMGEGEPAHNLDNVIRAVQTMTSLDGLQLSHNKITVSTSGLVPEIRRFAVECKANLAVSLHATNDELRSWLMPINRKYPLGELMQSLRDVFPRDNVRQQKVFFQYLMLKGVNDSMQDAKDLLRLTSGVPCKINLINFNSHDGTLFEASDGDTMLAFQDFLVKKGMTVTIRKSRGDEKMMACGQLGKLGDTVAPRMRVPEKYAHAVKEQHSSQSP